jgi:hypothetical protein
MTTVYLVLGDNGFGNSGNVVLGMYPTADLALRRADDVESDGERENVWIQQVEVGPNGSALYVPVEG